MDTVMFEGIPLVYHWSWSYNDPCTLSTDGFLLAGPLMEICKFD